MESKQIAGLAIYFEAGEAAAADLLGSASAQSLDLIRDLWGLEPPEECRVYVMTSWPRFLFHAAPLHWRVYLALTLPLRFARIQKMWAMAGGWALRYGRRHAIGIKPPRLLRKVDAGLRERVFVRREVDDWVRHNTCHELVHACSDDLHLPTWLHEGLAMVTVDRFAGQATVQSETLQTLAGESAGTRAQARYGHPSSAPDALVRLAVRGYWITRYLAETQPALLREQSAQRQPHEALEAALAAGLGLEPKEFWSQIDGLVLSYFEAASTP
jgi:hypothetical protein